MGCLILRIALHPLSWYLENGWGWMTILFYSVIFLTDSILLWFVSGRMLNVLVLVSCRISLVLYSCCLLIYSIPYKKNLNRNGIKKNEFIGYILDILYVMSTLFFPILLFFIAHTTIYLFLVNFYKFLEILFPL